MPMSRQPSVNKSKVLHPHIAETVDSVAQIHSDHHLKRTPMEKFLDNWTARRLSGLTTRKSDGARDLPHPRHPTRGWRIPARFRTS
jgi:hypothetical protein